MMLCGDGGCERSFLHAIMAEWKTIMTETNYVPYAKTNDNWLLINIDGEAMTGNIMEFMGYFFTHPMTRSQYQIQRSVSNICSITA